MSISAKWREKKEDQKAGLSFDWRFLVPSGWRLVYYALPIILAGVALLASIEVRSDTSLEQGARRLGNVFYLREEEHGGLSSFLSRNLPLASRGPVWADPASLGVDSETFSPMQGGLHANSSGLQLVEPVWPRGELDHLADHLVLSPPNTEGHERAAAEATVEIRPSVNVKGAELAAFIDSESYPAIDGRPDMGGFETGFWVIVDQWGKPRQVLIIHGSGDREIDKAAETYIKTLRWEPFSATRSGELNVGWKEVERFHEL